MSVARMLTTVWNFKADSSALLGFEKTLANLEGKINQFSGTEKINEKLGDLGKGADTAVNKLGGLLANDKPIKEFGPIEEVTDDLKGLAKETEKGADGLDNFTDELTNTDQKLKKYDDTLVKTDESLKSLSGPSKAKTEVGKLTKEAEKSEKSFDEFFKTVEKGFIRFTMLVSGAVTASVGAAIGITSAFAESASEIDKNSQRLGISAESLQAWSYSASLLGTPVDRLNDAFKDFGERIQDLNLFDAGEGKEGFKAMGISIKDASGELKTNAALLSETADWFAQNSDQRKKILVADKLFADAGFDMIPILNQGSEALRAQANEAKNLGLIVGGSSLKASNAYRESLTKTTAVFKGLSNELGAKILPILTSLIDKWQAYIKENREVLSTGLNNFLEMGLGLIDRMSSALMTGIDMFASFSEKIGGADKVMNILSISLGLVAAGMLAVNTQVLLIPALIAAATLLIAAMIEDIMTWAEGGESFFGDLISWAKDAFKTFENTPVERFLKSVLSLFDSIKNAAPKAFKDVMDYIKPFIESLKSAWEMLKYITVGSKEGGGYIKGFLNDSLDYLAEHANNLKGSIDSYANNDNNLKFTPDTHPQHTEVQAPNLSINYSPVQNTTVPEGTNPVSYAKAKAEADITELERLLARGITRDTLSYRET